MQVVHCRCANATVIAVDTTHPELNVVAEDLIRLHPLAARRSDLDEDGLIRCDVAVGQHLAPRLEAMPDALGVVEPIDAEQHMLGGADLFPDLPAAGLHGWVTGQPLDLFDL